MSLTFSSPFSMPSTPTAQASSQDDHAQHSGTAVSKVTFEPDSGTEEQRRWWLKASKDQNVMITKPTLFLFCDRKCVAQIEMKVLESSQKTFVPVDSQQTRFNGWSVTNPALGDEKNTFSYGSGSEKWPNWVGKPVDYRLEACLAVPMEKCSSVRCMLFGASGTYPKIKRQGCSQGGTISVSFAEFSLDDSPYSCSSDLHFTFQSGVLCVTNIETSPRAFTLTSKEVLLPEHERFPFTTTVVMIQNDTKNNTWSTLSHFTLIPPSHVWYQASDLKMTSVEWRNSKVCLNPTNKQEHVQFLVQVCHRVRADRHYFFLLSFDSKRTRWYGQNAEQQSSSAELSLNCDTGAVSQLILHHDSFVK